MSDELNHDLLLRSAVQFLGILVLGSQRPLGSAFGADPGAVVYVWGAAHRGMGNSQVIRRKKGLDKNINHCSDVSKRLPLLFPNRDRFGLGITALLRHKKLVFLGRFRKFPCGISP